MTDENKIKKFEYGVMMGAFWVGLIAGFGVCFHFEDKFREDFKIHSIYLQDVNRDGKEDIIIQGDSEKKYPYINMGDGTYLSLDLYTEHLKQLGVDTQLKTIEDCLNSDQTQKRGEK